MRNALEIGFGIWVGGLSLIGTIWAAGAVKDFIKSQKYGGVEWYRWRVR